MKRTLSLTVIALGLLGGMAFAGKCVADLRKEITEGARQGQTEASRDLADLGLR